MDSHENKEEEQSIRCTSGRVILIKHFAIDQISMKSQEFKGGNNEGPATLHTRVCSLSNERIAESIISLGESIKYGGSHVISYLTGSDDRLNENALNVDSQRKLHMEKKIATRMEFILLIT